MLVTARPPRELIERRDPPHYRQGDLLWLKGDLEAPESFGDFDFPRYLAQQGVGSTMAFPRHSLLDTGQGPALERWLFNARSRLAESLREALPEPQAGVALALVLGIRSDVDPGLEQDFRDSGTTHLLAISGLHVGIVMLAALWAVRRLVRRPRLLVFALPALVMWGYALLAGLPPSAARAAIMGSFYLAALYFGRQRHGFEALLIAAIVITAFDPRALWQVSFQLSFLAMAGIIIANDFQRVWMPAARPGEAETLAATAVRWLAAAVVMGLAATAFTWPAIAFYFHRVSLVGVPATVAALLALPPALVFSVAAGVVGLASAEAAWVFAWGAWLSLGYIVWAVELMASLAIASVRVDDFGRWLVVGYYVLLAGAVWALLRGRRSLARPRPALAIPASLRLSRFGALALGLALLSALVWTGAARQPSQNLRVTFLDVGHGDAILIQTPSRHTILVDGGPDPGRLARGLGGELSFWERRIDLVVATHAHADHVGGLPEALARYDVRRALEPGLDVESAAYEAWRSAVGREAVPVTTAEAGQSIVLGRVIIDVLHPPARPLLDTPSDPDNNAIVLRVAFGDVSFLLTSDIHVLAEDFLLDQGLDLRSTVLKAGHHGSRTSTSERFLEAVRPAVVVITSDAGRRFGHPHAETLATLARHVAPRALFDTGRDGTVSFETDGERLWVETGR